MKTQNTSISQKSIDQIQEKEQALYGWIAVSSAEGEVAGRFSGIKVMAGETATLDLTFLDESTTCNTNGLSIDLVEGDYLPTKNLTAVTVTAGKVFLIKEQKI